eukprot:9080280-Pyramimonas_sp.AAC.1
MPPGFCSYLSMRKTCARASGTAIPRWTATSCESMNGQNDGLTEVEKIAASPSVQEKATGVRNRGQGNGE